jgi:soluble lytic murein transglycosylase-like protein
MPARIAIFAAILLTILGLSAPRAHAQIAFYTDSDGRKVFINANAPPAPKRSAAASRAHATAPPSVAASTNSAEPSDASSPAAPSVLGDSTSAAATEESTDAPTPDEPAAAKPTLDQMVNEVATRHNVDPQLVRAVIGAESNWNPRAVSRTGAQGLMQLEPSTARQLGVSKSFDPQQNLEGGVTYLRSLLVRYGGDLDKALAAYNAGPGAVDRAGGVPHILETENYVQRVTANYNHPGSDHAPRGLMEVSHPIYRSTDGSGRIVFTNE